MPGHLRGRRNTDVVMPRSSRRDFAKRRRSRGPRRRASRCHCAGSVIAAFGRRAGQLYALRPLDLDPSRAKSIGAQLPLVQEEVVVHDNDVRRLGSVADMVVVVEAERLIWPSH